MDRNDELRACQLFSAMQKLYLIVNPTCSGVGDVSLGEYALLLEVSEFEGGIPLRELEHAFSFLVEPHYVVSLLESKELMRRTRNRSDKRAYSCEVTTKGRARVAYIDEALAIALISVSPKLDEDEMAALIERFHQLAAFEPKRHPTTMFPAALVVEMYRYHSRAAHACSVMGLPLVQASLLCSLAVSRDMRASKLLIENVPMLASIVDFQLGHLVDKGLVVLGEEYSITERGYRRLAALFAAMDSDKNYATPVFPDHVQEYYEEAVGYLLYLFG